MKIEYFVVLKILSILYNAYCTEGSESLENTGQLIFVNMLYRHGDRAPDPPYTKDPYRSEVYWPNGYGELTNEGKLRHYNLGQWLRRRYQSLIPKRGYSPNLIYIQSTDYNRTLSSAYVNLAGMFPPTEDENWSQLNWQPIPVHTVPLIHDKILYMDDVPCKKYELESKKYFDSPEMKKYFEDLTGLFDYLSKNTGDKIDSLFQVAELYTTLKIESSYNLTLPDWTRSVFPDKLYPPAAFSFSSETLTPVMKRLRGGPLLKEMLDHMKMKIQGTLKPDRSLWVYSAHDVTVGSLLNTLGVFNKQPPPFAALLLMELWKKSDNEHFISVLYKNSTAEPEVLTIPGCSASCPVESFENLLKEVIPIDWDSECNSV